MLKYLLWTVVITLAIVFPLEQTAMGSIDLPAFNPANFTPGQPIDNQYLPMVPGLTYRYEGEVEEESETILVSNEVFTTYDTRTILGVLCRVVQDTEWADGEIGELTREWFSQDNDGNIWYFGEDVDIYEGGVVVSHDGSWEAGVDGALPGYLMKGNPLTGENPYYQEYYAGVAEDIAQVLSLSEPVSIGFGDYDNCLQVLEWNPLDDPVGEEHKFFAPSVGLVFIVELEDNIEFELVSIVPEPATLSLLSIAAVALIRRRNGRRA